MSYLIEYEATQMITQHEKVSQHKMGYLYRVIRAQLNKVVKLSYQLDPGKRDLSENQPIYVYTQMVHRHFEFFYGKNILCLAHCA